MLSWTNAAETKPRHMQIWALCSHNQFGFVSFSFFPGILRIYDYGAGHDELTLFLELYFVLLHSLRLSLFSSLCLSLSPSFTRSLSLSPSSPLSLSLSLVSRVSPDFRPLSLSSSNFPRSPTSLTAFFPKSAKNALNDNESIW